MRSAVVFDLLIDMRIVRHSGSFAHPLGFSCSFSWPSRPSCGAGAHPRMGGTAGFRLQVSEWVGAGGAQAFCFFFVFMHMFLILAIGINSMDVSNPNTLCSSSVSSFLSYEGIYP